MKIKYRDKHYFLTHKLNRKSGTSEAIEFYDSICLETIEAFKKYYKKMPKYAKEHGFLHKEQQVKTFLTLAIGKVTDCSFLQEHPTDRLKNQKKAKNNSTTAGHFDYWANYKKSSFLIEVKHNWIRYYPEDNRFTFYKVLDDNLKHAVDQVDEIADKTGFKYAQNLFGLGLIVAPVFIQDKTEKRLSGDMPKIVLRNETIKDLSDNGLWDKKIR